MLINSSKKKYREDITGLRAIAVIAVVIFHIFPSVLKGGYLGVDIFFVISGFLITKILLREKLKLDSVNILNFYRKRILRIMPALIVVLCLASVLAYFLIDHRTLHKFTREIIFSILGFANIYFKHHLDTSYFAPATNTKLLLHLWSLGVEWQFYILFPFLILFFKAKNLLKVFISLFIVSFIAAILVSKIDYMFDYYMLPTRAFELLIGSIGAYLVLTKNKALNLLNNKILNNCLALICLIFIILSFIFINESYLLPNELSLIVILPTIILILIGSKKSSLVNKFIANEVFIYIGLWSYSIYLYHWVLVSSYHNIYGEGNINLKVGFLIFVLSIILSATSYYLVEKPLQKVKWNVVIAFSVLILIPLGYFSYQYLSYSKYSFRNKYEAASPKDPLKYENICDWNIFNESCIVNKAKGEPNILVMGDSNAYHYMAVFKAIAKNLDFSFRNETLSGCNFFLANTREEYKKFKYDSTKHGDCYSYSQNFFSLSKNYDVVVISQLWVYVYNLLGEYTFREEIDKTIKYLSENSKLVLIIANSPETETLNIMAITGTGFIKIKDNSRNNLNDPMNQEVNGANNALKEVAANYKNVYFVEGFRNAVCNETDCEYKHGKNSLYFNPNHYSVYGEEYIAKKYIKKGIEPVWYKVKALYKDRTNIKILPNGNVKLK